MKVLIVSHNPIKTNNSMGKTMLTLFSGFEKSELCQFYIYPTLPDVKKCQSYYRITDKDVLKSYLKLRVNGREISTDDVDEDKHVLFEDGKDEVLYRNRKNNNPVRIWARDVMWKWSRWYSKELRRWIEKEKPTHIFVAPGSSKFIYDIALKIAKMYKLPIVTYICDDFYFVKKSESFWGRIQQRTLKKKIEKLMANTSKIITICDELKDAYEKHFNITANTVMTGSNYEIATEPQSSFKIKTLTYMGNIRCNRYRSLVKIGKALDSINQELKSDYKLDIYSSEKDKDILSLFENLKSVNMRGFLTGQEFDKRFHESEVLLHVEDFDEESIDVVKNSVSTKIADSLGSGICLFAFAPKQVASMNYLIKTNSAICCVDENELEEKLKLLFCDDEYRKSVVKNALETAENNHEKNSVGKKVRQVFEGIKNEDTTN